MRATVVIATKNRKQDLLQAIKSSLGQTIKPEILVIDDGSSDGTAEMVAAEFPFVRFVRSEQSRGYIVQRNRGVQMASGDVIFSIDDDAIFMSEKTIQQTLLEFDHPNIGAVAIPYTEPKKSVVVHQKSPSSDNIFITNDFIGTSHAIRKDVFVQLGGYREYLFHQGEEKDYCIRMLDAGYLVRLGNADLIHHMESDKRDFSRMDFYGCRNSILFAWLNVPWLMLPIHLAGTTIKCLLWSLESRRFRVRLKGVIAGYRDIFRYTRQPVSIATYRTFRMLAHLPRPINEVISKQTHVSI
jgi:GT2 family glycosyltransferase